MSPKEGAVQRLLYIALLMIFLGTGLGVFIFARVLSSQAKQTDAINRAVQELKNDNLANDKVIIDHINCIGLFLSQPNRGEVRIADLQDCKIAPN